MGKRTRSPELPREYEGEAILQALLEQAGSSLPVAKVKERIRSGLAKKLPPSEVLPDLFEEEPTFGSPDEALRLYSNLFGLWDRVEAGKTLEPVSTARPRKQEKPPRAPAPSPQPEGPLGEAFVEAAWRYLADLEPREQERLLHRYENQQPELSEFVRMAALESTAAIETADTLAFELWAMLELARPQPRHQAVSLKEIQAQLASSASVEPALEQYVDEALEEAGLDEESPLPAGEVEKVRGLVLAVLRALLNPRSP